MQTANPGRDRHIDLVCAEANCYNVVGSLERLMLGDEQVYKAIVNEVGLNNLTSAAHTLRKIAQLLAERSGVVARGQVTEAIAAQMAELEEKIEF